jgi:hypothetical protein
MSDHRELLQRAGQALYGDNWQSELARALGISDRTMRRWIAEPYVIAAGVWGDLDRLLLARVMTIEKLRNDLVRATVDGDLPH